MKALWIAYKLDAKFSVGREERCGFYVAVEKKVWFSDGGVGLRVSLSWAEEQTLFLTCLQPLIK